MKLIVYLCCQELDCNQNEQPIQLEWSDHQPRCGDTIAMGDQQRWLIVDVMPYQSTAADLVFLVHVNPSHQLCDRKEWDSSFARANENIHIELSNRGEPALQIGFNVLGQAPQIGSRLMNYEPTNHPTLMKETPSEWVVDRYDEFLPTAPNAPYNAIYLSWCKQLALV